MARKLSVAEHRRAGIRLFFWAALALAGIAGGVLLGEMAVGTRLGDGARDSASYSRLSANPDALVPGGDAPSPACPGCADSYGVAARLRAERDDRMSDEFRALGAVDAEHMLAPEPTDDGYRYGGRFPDPPDADADITHDEAAPADAESGIPSVDGSGAPGAEY